MKIDLPQHPIGLHKKASPPTSQAEGENEYASFAAQLAARAERLAAERAAAGSHREEPASHSPFFLLASGRAGYVWAAFLLLLCISISVLAVWGLPFRPSELLPPSLTEQAKAGVSSTGKPEAKVSLPVSAPPARAAVRRPGGPGSQGLRAPLALPGGGRPCRGRARGLAGGVARESP